MHKDKLSKVLAVPFIIIGLLLTAACVSASGSAETGDPAIAGVVAEHTTIYPLGNTSVTCSASSKDGSALSYRWICNDGTITGSGPTINWEAPKTYGDFHIMCVVEDGAGHSNSKATTVTVIVRDPSKCCK